MSVQEFERAQQTLWHAHTHLADYCMESDAHAVLIWAENELRREMRHTVKIGKYQEA